jgi:hypothetical protein
MRRAVHIYTPVLFFIASLSGSGILFAQEPGEPDAWDNQLFLGNKVAAVKGDWKFSGELQVRLKDNAQSLDRWFLEGVATYMPSEHWELVPDYRLSIKSEHVEHRPGLGILRKDLYGPAENKKHQLVHQLKWQADIGSGYVDHGLRYVFFYNYVLSEKLIPNVAAGVFYRWSEGYTGVQFFRLGAGLAYILDVKHSLNFSYFIGITDTGTNWTYQGIPFIQLIININRDYKYVPAKYVNF